MRLIKADQNQAWKLGSLTSLNLGIGRDNKFQNFKQDIDFQFEAIQILRTVKQEALKL